MIIRLQLLEKNNKSLSYIEEYLPDETAEKLYKEFHDMLKSEVKRELEKIPLK